LIGIWNREVLSASPLQTNVSIVNANIDRQRIRMLNFPQFIVVYFLFPRRSLTHHQVFFSGSPINHKIGQQVTNRGKSWAPNCQSIDFYIFLTQV